MKHIMVTYIVFFFSMGLMISLISAEWYKSQVIIMESWAYVLKDDKETDTFVLDDTFLDTAQEYEKQRELDFSASETRVRNIAIELFSAAIYGYDFTYVPSNASRQIQEAWTLEPVARISYDDARLIEIERNMHKGELHIFYRYNLIDQQVYLLQAWEENSKVLYSKGEGISLNNPKALVQTDVRINALYDAIQSAIRDRMKDTLSSTTRKVKGRVRLTTQPFFTDYVSYFRSRINVMLYITNAEFYEVF